MNARTPHDRRPRVRWLHRSRLRLVTFAALCAAALLVPASAADADNGAKADTSLETALLNSVAAADFGSTIDFGPVEGLCPGARFCNVPALPVRHLPNVDVAVIEFDEAGNVTDAANVLVSRDYPEGVVVPLDMDAVPAGSYSASSVRWRRWDIDRFNGGTFDPRTGQLRTVKGWTDNPPLTDADDIVPGRQSAPLQFMSPYPASLFKVVVAFRIMRLVDSGDLSLDTQASSKPTVEREPERRRPASVARAGRVAAGAPQKRAIRDLMFAMVTYSDNDSTRALLQVVMDHGGLEAMHAELRELGLDTLQINGIDPSTGGNWQPGQIHMTAMDTARLLWLIDGGNGSLWTRPDDEPVSASMLSDGSRAYLKGLLDEQGYHEALSTSILCGAANVNPGIPALVPQRWITRDGTVTVDGYRYGHDARPCNATAEVIFGHKTGLTFNYGSDAGIVRSLPGKSPRHYIIAFLSNIGYRYTDAPFASRSTYPCSDRVGPICYTQRIPALARRIDDVVKATT